MTESMVVRPATAPVTALFVDAGWVHAAAAIAVAGGQDRGRVSCDHRGLVGALCELIVAHSGGMRHLRTYWYDAAAGAMPTVEHNRIALVPYVTVRLGRLTRDRAQKGVDVRIYRDLVQLSRERSIARAYLLAGDDDLRDAVVDAKELGVQVVLLGMPIERGHNQSALLVREADEVVQLPLQVWKPHFAVRDRPLETDDEAVAKVRELGETFAIEWAARVPREDVVEVLDGFPTLPQALDIDLVVFAEREVGGLRQRPDLKSELRGTFWFALKQAAGRRGGDGSSGQSEDPG